MVGWGERTLGFSLLTGFVLLFDETYDHDKQRDLLTKWVVWLVGASAPLVFHC